MNLKPRTPKPKSSRADRAIALLRHGPEPEFTRDRELTPSEIGKFTTWHHYVTDRSEGLEWLHTFLKLTDGRLYESVSRIKERHIADSFFWKARLFNLGYTVPSSILEHFRTGLKQLVTMTSADDGLEFEIDEETGEERLITREDDTPKPIVRKSRHTETINRFYDFIEDAEVSRSSAYTMIKEENISPAALNAVLTKFGPMAEDIRRTIAGFDDETKRLLAKADPSTHSSDRAAYAREKKFLQLRLSILESVINDVNVALGNAKKERKPRKKKVLSVEKRVSHVKYQKEDVDLKLTSIQPSKILGAQELWMYNTKYNFLSVYRATNDAGLDIKGTTLLNWDEKRSYYKKLGRRPGEHINEILNTTKARLKRVMDEIKADAGVVNGRINENTILLRVV